MLRTISGGASLLAQLQARFTTTRQNQTKSVADQLKAAGVVLPDDKLEDLRRAEEALNKLKQVTDSQKDERKAAAREKIERLKKELQTLRMMAGSGDPKAIARQAKRIAAELASAAKEYASAGGGAGATAGGASDGAAAGPDAAAGAEGGDAAKAEAEARKAATEGTGGAEDGKAPAENQQGTADAAEQKATEAEQKAEAAERKEEKDKAEAVKDGDGKDEPAKASTPEEQRQASAEVFQKMAGEISKQGAATEADRKFVEDVKDLFREVKSIMDLQRRRAKEQGRDDKEMEQMSKDIGEAGKDIDAAFSGGAAEMFTPVSVLV